MLTKVSELHDMTERTVVGSGGTNSSNCRRKSKEKLHIHLDKVGKMSCLSA